ncbi:MAG: hypothetical protein ACOC3A_08950 [Thermodesulfobacteriota bacterium]
MPEEAIDRDAWIEAYHRLAPASLSDALDDGLLMKEFNREPMIRISRAFGTGERFKKGLLIGQEGCGKTTILSRLSRREPLIRRNRPICFSIFETLNLVDIETVDILLMIYTHLVRAAAEEGWELPTENSSPLLIGITEAAESEPPVGDPSVMLCVRYKSDSAFRRKIRNSLKADIESVQARISTLCGLFSRRVHDCFMITEAVVSKLQAEDVSEKVLSRLRAVSYREYKSEVAFLRMLEEAIGEIQARHYQSLILKHAWLEIPRDPLFLIDDADRLGRGDIERIFFRESHLLTTIPAGMVFAFPLFAAHLNSFSRIQDRFESVFLRPLFLNPEAETPAVDPQGEMAHLIIRRMAPEMVSEDALEYLIGHSGGMIGTLMGLIRNGCRLALQHRASVIDRSMAETLVQDFKKRFARLADIPDWRRHARAVVESRKPQPEDGSLVHLFRHNLVLEYHTPEGEIRRALHPGMQPPLN